MSKRRGSIRERSRCAREAWTRSARSWPCRIFGGAGAEYTRLPDVRRSRGAPRHCAKGSSWPRAPQSAVPFLLRRAVPCRPRRRSAVPIPPPRAAASRRRRVPQLARPPRAIPPGPPHQLPPRPRVRAGAPAAPRPGRLGMRPSTPPRRRPAIWSPRVQAVRAPRCERPIRPRRSSSASWSCTISSPRSAA